MAKRCLPFAAPKPSVTSAFHIARTGKKDEGITEEDVTTLISEAEAEHKKDPKVITIDDIGINVRRQKAASV